MYPSVGRCQVDQRQSPLVMLRPREDLHEDNLECKIQAFESMKTHREEASIRFPCA